MDLPDFIRNLPPVDLPYPGSAVSTHALPSPHGLLAFFEFHQDFDIPPHAHGAQWGTVLEGWVELTIAGETRRYTPGMSYAIPAGVEHAVRLPAGAKAIDLFEEPDRWKLRQAPP